VAALSLTARPSQGAIDWRGWIGPFFGSPGPELMRRRVRIGPFVLYVRWWHDRVMLADIIAEGGGRSGSLSDLLDGLEAELPTLGFHELHAENVFADWLIAWLERRGFQPKYDRHNLMKVLR